MFRSPRHYRSFLTILLTYTLDLVGFSIVFPVLAPLLLDPSLQFFAPDTPLAEKTTVLGLLFAFFGIAQFFGSPFSGALADHYGRFKTFLGTIALSVFGYALMALSLYLQNLSLLFAGRIITGFCSGNFILAQSATADLTDEKNRPRAFGVLLGVGGLGFVIGPWVGGKLADPTWLFGSGAFIFAAIAALINFFAVLFFFEETMCRKEHPADASLLKTFKDIWFVFHRRVIRRLLITYLIFSIGWGFFLSFSPTFLVQKFSLGPDKIGDMYAYMALIWFFVSMYVNKELLGYFSLRALSLVGMALASCGVALFVLPETLWPYWFIIPVALTGGALFWINLGSSLSVSAPEHMQGRVLGASGSMWSIGQIVSPLAAGPLAGWNLYAPLVLGSIIIALSFFYFVILKEAFE